MEKILIYCNSYFLFAILYTILMNKNKEEEEARFYMLFVCFLLPQRLMLLCNLKYLLLRVYIYFLFEQCKALALWVFV